MRNAFHSPRHLLLLIAFSLSPNLSLLSLSQVVFADEFVRPEARLQPELPQDPQLQKRCIKTSAGYMLPYEVQIPGTETRFRMVPVPGRKASDGKQLEPFWIGQYEVTWGEYVPYMLMERAFKQKNLGKKAQPISLSNVDALTAPTALYDVEGRFEYARSPKSPAVTMTQFAARQYTKWLSTVCEQNYRLPIESEWQHACLAGSDAKWCSGANVAALSKYAVFDVADDSGPQDVGSKEPNAWDIYDMHGNVAEWVIQKDKLRGPPPRRLSHGDWLLSMNHYHWLAYGGSWLSNANECTFDSHWICDEDGWMEDPSIPFSPWWLANFDIMTAVGFRIVSPLKEIRREAMAPYWRPDSSEQFTELTMLYDSGRLTMDIFEVQKIDWVQEVLKEDLLRPIVPWKHGKK